ncbi:MAG: 50S ribosomal protein L1 [Chloroflexi bacterium]|nr:50S ribosomal protein L1 [Chloroflexota bacterium]MCI0790420.1 50S ribosomal protein L1 [Chloroflexota bacterium]MCI0795545.1 50S ribosomal protein L1 [Chloroflexota bacterium]MCI0812286.1 50S ribosomal protein L1 [Chloroflexota bacterium]
MRKQGKRFEQALAQVDADRDYQPEEAVALVKTTATAKFDETVEVHLRTGSDPRHADQMIRGVALLPHGVGKNVRVTVFTQGETEAVAQEAGADFVGADDLIKRIEDGWTDFDVSIATPDMMVKVGKLGRILGRRGLMPNPRTGTVVQPENLPQAIREAKMGRVEYRVDKSSLIHVPIGKASFDERQLMENLTTLMDNIVRARPSGIKGQYIRSAFLTTTMGPSIRMDVASATALKVE